MVQQVKNWIMSRTRTSGHESCGRRDSLERQLIIAACAGHMAILAQEYFSCAGLNIRACFSILSETFRGHEVSSRHQSFQEHISQLFQGHFLSSLRAHHLQVKEMMSSGLHLCSKDSRRLCGRLVFSHHSQNNHTQKENAGVGIFHD